MKWQDADDLDSSEDDSSDEEPSLKVVNAASSSYVYDLLPPLVSASPYN